MHSDRPLPGDTAARGGIITFRRLALLSTLALAAALMIFSTGLFSGTDQAIYDAYSTLRMRFFPPTLTKPPIIAAIDASSLRRYGRWPWPRAGLARLLQAIAKGKPSVIAVDLLFADPSPGDAQLAAALGTGKFVLAERLDLRRMSPGGMRTERPEPPHAVLARVARAVGFIDFFPDRDGVARRMLTQYTSGSVKHLSLAAAMAAQDGLGNPADSPATMLLTIGCRPREIPVISASLILNGKADPDLWRGRAVLIGLTAPGGSADLYQVAVRALGRLPGVYLHAYAYASLREWGHERDLPFLAQLCILLVALTALAAFGRAGRPWRSALGFCAVSTALILAALLLFAAQWWWRPSLTLTAIFFAAAGYQINLSAVAFQRERRLRVIFAKYVSPAALHQILAAPYPVLGGEEREITVIFADLRGFTAYAEGRHPFQVACELNRHLSLMARIVLEAGGMVDKFMGDAIMGVFGAPLMQPDHREKALAAAVSIIQSLSGPGFLPPGIGMAAGRAVVGNIGSEERLEYTAVGDPINLAARLEELAGPGEILADISCFRAAPDANWRVLGEVSIRGREALASVYRFSRRQG